MAKKGKKTSLKKKTAKKKTKSPSSKKTSGATAKKAKAVKTSKKKTTTKIRTKTSTKPANPNIKRVAKSPKKSRRIKTHLNKRDLETAGQYLNDAEPIVTDAIETFNQFAIQLRKQGKMDESVKQYEKCLNVFPNHPIVQFNLAVTYFQMGNFIQAKAQLMRCLQINPKYNDANKLLTIVNQKLQH